VLAVELPLGLLQLAVEPPPLPTRELEGLEANTVEAVPIAQIIR
jgi:hypothetical protein